MQRTGACQFFLAVMLLITARSQAQNCNCPPTSVAGLEHRPNPTYYDKVKCAEYNGETSCVFACNYVLTSNSAYQVIVTVSWVKNVRSNTNYSCRVLLQGYNLGSSSRYAWGKTYVSKQRQDIAAEATRLAQNLLKQVEPYSALCPGASPADNNNGRTTDPVNKETLCRKNADKLTDLQANIAVIESELRYLANYKNKETECRDLLSYYNKLIAAMNTPGYKGPLKNDVDLFKNDKDYRSKQASKIGIDPGKDAISIARNIRNILQDRLDYLSDAPTFISRFNTQKQLAELDLAKIRAEMSRYQCGGRYDVANCNMTGKWKFTYFRGGVKESEDTWEFSPSGAGRYSGRALQGNHSGTAEVYGNEIIVRSVYDGVQVNHKIVMFSGCNTGNGVRKIGGNLQDSLVTSVAKQQDAVSSFVKDKLYNLRYNGFTYQGLYQLDTKGSISSDLFYFKVMNNNGYQAEQDGEKLWGRFVRVPSVTHSDQSAVTWWYVTWVYKNNRWVQEQKKNVVVEFF